MSRALPDMYDEAKESSRMVIVCLDDDPRIRELLERLLGRAGHRTIPARHVPEALKILSETHVDLVISDFQLPGIDGLEFLDTLARDGNAPPVIMITGHGDIDHAVKAMRRGAVDYLVKPFNATELVHRVDLALSAARLRGEVARLRREAAEQRVQSRMVGSSISMRRLTSLISAAAASRATVLIQGESGTGKELVASAIREQSARRDKPFIRLNCAALPEGLVEAALFGHEKGAFTGAVRRVEGAFERAHGGTLLLDEISEMRLDLQAKLLRVLQEREFERVGGSELVKTDVRVLATTNRNLEADSQAGSFRRDLFFRLSVIPILLPPLRSRAEDIPSLAYLFMARAAAEGGKHVDTISAEAMDVLQRYAWPGNVRELQHTIERAVILGRSSTLGLGDFDQIRRSLAGNSDASAAGPSISPAPGALVLSSLNLDDAESAIVARALELSEGNRTRAAALLGIGVRALRKRLQRSREDSAQSD